MNSYELEQARRYKKHQENMKDPDYAAAYEAAQRRKKERERSEEILRGYAANGFFRPQMPEKKPKEKSAEELRRDDILKHFS